MRKEKRGFREIITDGGGRAHSNVVNDLQQEWANRQHCSRSPRRH